MSLSEQLKKDIVAAMKGKEEMRLSVLRMAKAALQLKEVEKMRPLDETESIQLLQTLVKQRKESIDQFEKGGRKDLVDKENAELKFLEAYLPAGASEAEMDAAIAKAIADTGATSMKQMGGVSARRGQRSRDGRRDRESHCRHRRNLHETDGRRSKSRERSANGKSRRRQSPKRPRPRKALEAGLMLERWTFVRRPA